MSTADPSFEMLGPQNSQGETLLTGGPQVPVCWRVLLTLMHRLSCVADSEFFTAIQAMATIDGNQQVAEGALAK